MTTKNYVIEHPDEWEEQNRKRRDYWKKRREKGETATGIEQKKDYTSYMREYQKLWRAKHPEYYRNLQRKKRNKTTEEGH